MSNLYPTTIETAKALAKELAGARQITAQSLAERDRAVELIVAAMPWLRCLDSHNCPDIRPASEAYDWPDRTCPACTIKAKLLTFVSAFPRKAGAR